jgi:hypothetical protein
MRSSVTENHGVGGSIPPLGTTNYQELELCDEVRETLTREIGGIEERIACLKSSRDVLSGYLQQDVRLAARRKLA